MTCRSILLTFVSLLLLASLAGAAVPPVATADPAVGAAAFMTPAAPATTSPGCAKADIPFLAPAPSQKSATCGSCSETVCAGYSVGTVCAYRSGVTYTCQDVYGGTCGGSPITLICNCWHGPLP